MKHLLLIAAVFAVSCTRKEAPETTDDAPAKAGRQCYVYSTGKDTIRMSLLQNDANVTGELTFRFMEKDNSHGTLSGLFVGDTLFAEYTFRAEGTTSVREMIILRKNNTLLVGNGEMTEASNKQMFKDPKAVSFENAVELRRTSCR